MSQSAGVQLIRCKPHAPTCLMSDPEQSVPRFPPPHSSPLVLAEETQTQLRTLTGPRAFPEVSGPLVASADTWGPPVTSPDLRPGPGICIINQPHDEVIIQAQVSQIQGHTPGPGFSSTLHLPQPNKAPSLDLLPTRSTQALDQRGNVSRGGNFFEAQRGKWNRLRPHSRPEAGLHQNPGPGSPPAPPALFMGLRGAEYDSRSHRTNQW